MPVVWAFTASSTFVPPGKARPLRVAACTWCRVSCVNHGCMVLAFTSPANATSLLSERACFSGQRPQPSFPLAMLADTRTHVHHQTHTHVHTNTQTHTPHMQMRGRNSSLVQPNSNKLPSFVHLPNGMHNFQTWGDSIAGNDISQVAFLNCKCYLQMLGTFLWCGKSFRSALEASTCIHLHAHVHTLPRSHARAHTHSHARTHKDTYTRTHTLLRARTHTRTHTHTHTHTHAHTRTHTLTHTPARTHAHTHTHTHTLTHTHTYTHTHTRKQVTSWGDFSSLESNPPGLNVQPLYRRYVGCDILGPDLSALCPATLFQIATVIFALTCTPSLQITISLCFNLSLVVEIGCYGMCFMYTHIILKYAQVVLTWARSS